MYTTTTTTIAAPDPVAAPAVPGARRSLARPGLVGGIGGLAFVASVLVQNAVRANFPANDAGAAEVVDFYAARRGSTLALAALFPIGAVGLVCFVGTVLARVGRRAGSSAAIAAAIGATALIATFTMLTTTDLAIAGHIHRGVPDLGVVDGLWVLHNAVFGMLLVSLGITFAALTTAVADDGLLSSRWKVAGRIGGALLLTAAATTPAIIDGSPTMFLGVAGFGMWVVFVARTSARLLRRPQD